MNERWVIHYRDCTPDLELKQVDHASIEDGKMVFVVLDARNFAQRRIACEIENISYMEWKR